MSKHGCRQEGLSQTHTVRIWPVGVWDRQAEPEADAHRPPECGGGEPSLALWGQGPCLAQPCTLSGHAGANPARFGTARSAAVPTHACCALSLTCRPACTTAPGLPALAPPCIWGPSGVTASPLTDHHPRFLASNLLRVRRPARRWRVRWERSRARGSRRRRRRSHLR